MKKISALRGLVGGAAATAVALATVGTVSAAPLADAARVTPPVTSQVSGPQAKPPVEPGTRDAKKLSSLGSTKLVRTDSAGKLAAAPAIGAVANVDFQAPLNYCSRGLTYTPLRNATTATKYVQVRFYDNGTYRDYYTSVAANSTVYPAFYGVSGTFYAYLYVWNGSSYVYDEYKTGSNVCNVSVTRTYNAGGWVQLKIQNLGTAYASQQSAELAPYPAYGTYTGTQYDYPVAGGAAIYRWFSVGTSPYAIVSHTLGSSNYPVYFTGDL